MTFVSRRSNILYTPKTWQICFTMLVFNLCQLYVNNNKLSHSYLKCYENIYTLPFSIEFARSGNGIFFFLCMVNHEKFMIFRVKRCNISYKSLIFVFPNFVWFLLNFDVYTYIQKSIKMRFAQWLEHLYVCQPLIYTYTRLYLVYIEWRGRECFMYSIHSPHLYSYSIPRIKWQLACRLKCYIRIFHFDRTHFLSWRISSSFGIRCCYGRIGKSFSQSHHKFSRCCYQNAPQFFHVQLSAFTHSASRQRKKKLKTKRKKIRRTNARTKCSRLFSLGRMFM